MPQAPQVAPEPVAQAAQPTAQAAEPTKFCKHCGATIPKDAVICTHCGRQVEEMNNSTPSIVINNSNENVNTNQNVNTNTSGVVMMPVKPRNKWVALVLCLFLGFFGAHKFYEGKIGMGVLYIFTGGLFGIGIIVDFIRLLFKPNPYYI